MSNDVRSVSIFRKMGVLSKFDANDDKTGFNPPSGNENNSNDEDDDEEELNSAEYEALDQQLDQLNSCLDVLEQQNDALKAELQNLLESSRQARREMMEEKAKQAMAESDDSDGVSNTKSS